ncbi:uncharacterized protein LOC116202213 [Punica granatum]|uniref:Uncharacterized protein LOC116202213 n=2 Tax=Punica granatum TaxID=22663 RepID=A0A6P8CZL5_PUNGR|nr:uncharacterized protein LOC116202213 [Punica granatum]PKI66388.1 hypothetical protein CRG98_013190 [Punica granatum]
MKKLYRKSTVYPSPPVVSDHLSFLPAAILTLAAALSPDDREVLAYLLLSNNNNNNTGWEQGSSIHRRPSSAVSPAGKGGGQRSCLPGKSDHPPMFSCDCFECYMSYWVRWDSSPNRQLIHEIIDQFEDGLVKSKGSNTKTKKERRKQTRGATDSKPPSSSSRDQDGFPSEQRPKKDDLVSSTSQSADSGTSDGGTTVTRGGEAAEEGPEKGSVRRLVGFIGERIWGVWN